MKITFCMPTHNYKSPIGGFKMVYEYANRLTEYGHEVCIVYCTKRSFQFLKIPFCLKQILAKIVVHNSPKWFDLSKKVKKIPVSEIDNNHIPFGDIIFATAQNTAEKVAKLDTTKGKKCYLIQDFENWNVSDDEVFKTYRLGLKNITISKWLYEIVKKSSDNTVCIPNPIDINSFRVIKPIEKRNKYSIGLLYHKAEYKGVKYALEALYKLKREYPLLEVHLFGTPKRPKELPKWFHYTQNATEKEVIEIYNKCAIYMCASVVEGFGLTGLESMACGCVLVSSAHKGIFEYGVNEVNALISPIKDVDFMVNNVKRVINDDNFRYKIAKNAVKSASDFAWEKAIKTMNEVIEQ